MKPKPIEMWKYIEGDVEGKQKVDQRILQLRDKMHAAPTVQVIPIQVTENGVQKWVSCIYVFLFPKE